MNVLLEACLLVILVNLPFGIWRSKVRKFSIKWFLAVHSSIPLIALIRVKLGLGWEWSTFPFMFASFFAGQWIGAKIGKRLYFAYFPRKKH